MSQISRQTHLITGAASGIGRATALALARRGARLLIVDRDPGGLDALEATLSGDAAYTGEIVGRVVADLSTDEGTRAVVEAALALPGGVDVLLNVAGICVVAPVEDTPWSDFDRLLAVNLGGLVRITQGLLPSMLARGRGHIVNVASISGMVGVPGFVAYGTTKHAVVGYSEGLRNELRGRGIRVTLVCPGIVNTPMKTNLTLRGFDDKVRGSIRGASPEGVAESIARAIERDAELITPAAWLLWTARRLFPALSGRLATQFQTRLLDGHRQR